MTDFAKYAFNKSHAAAYAMVAYQTAWLKTFFPVEFMAALLSAHLDDTNKITKYITEMGRMGIRLLPPDANESNAAFNAKGTDIRFGLAAVKNVGKSFATQIVDERKNGYFSSLKDFCGRMLDRGLNKRALEALIRAGAFDSLGGARSQYIAVFEKLINEASNERRSNFSGQLTLMGEDEAGDDLPNIAEFDKTELLSMEKEAMGIFVSGHPLDSCKTALSENSDTLINTILLSFSEDSEGEAEDGQQVRIAGIVTKIKKKYTKKNDEMAFITLEDLSGSIEVIIFPKTLMQFDSIIAEEAIISIIGRINAKEDEHPKIIMDAALPISTETPQSRLYIKIPEDSEDKLSRLKEIFKIYSGNVPVYLYFEKDKKTISAPKELWVTPCEGLNVQTRKIIGESCEIVHKKING